ncbi:MAG: hypothetical protein ACXV5Q_14025 [Frankiaceae bacterium]
MAEAGGVAALSGAHEAVSARHGNNHAPLVAAFYRSHRSALFDLLDAVDLQSTSTDHTVADAVAFLKVPTGHRTGELIPEHRDGVPVDLSFAGEMWQKILRDKARPGQLGAGTSRCACSATSPRSCVPAILRWLARTPTPTCTPTWMPWSTCEPLVADYSAQAGIPASAGEFAAWLKAELTQVAVAVTPATRRTPTSSSTRRPGFLCSRPAADGSGARRRGGWRRRSTSGSRSGRYWTS